MLPENRRALRIIHCLRAAAMAASPGIDPAPLGDRLQWSYQARCARERECRFSRQGIERAVAQRVENEAERISWRMDVTPVRRRKRNLIAPFSIDTRAVNLCHSQQLP